MEKSFFLENRFLSLHLNYCANMLGGQSYKRHLGTII